MTHCDRARTYSDDIAAGHIPACHWVQASCERQMRDLERFAASDSPYWFDQQAAERVCQFVEAFPHVKGQWAKGFERISLEPWQEFLLTTVYGWRRRDNGGRRFKTVYVEVARKNAKSTLASALGLYGLAGDLEPGAVVVSAATTRDQARLTFQDAQALARKESGFRRVFGVEVRAHAITQLRTGSTFYPLSAEGSHQDGLNVSLAIVDELHAHKDRRIWDVLESATGARLQPLIWAISTAGSNQNGICYEQRTYLCKLLDGLIEDDSYFGLIYTLDSGDDWKDSACWIKANPNLGVSIYPEDLERQARKAAETPAALGPFLTKRLNCWVNADSQWMDPASWSACARKDLQLADFAGEPCYIGLDLAAKSDLAAAALWFPACDRYPHTVFFRFYLSSDQLAKEENTLYRQWAKAGHLMVTPGPVTDWVAVADDLDGFGVRFDVQEVACDPWQLPPLVGILNRRSFDVPIVEVRQIVATLSPAMKELEALILQKAVVHDANPVQAWMFSNVVCHRDEKDNYYPRKPKPDRTKKIDGVIALLLASDRVLRIYGTASAYQDGAGFKTVTLAPPPAPATASGDYLAGLDA